MPISPHHPSIQCYPTPCIGAVKQNCVEFLCSKLKELDSCTERLLQRMRSRMQLKNSRITNKDLSRNPRTCHMYFPTWSQITYRREYRRRVNSRPQGRFVVKK